MLNCFWLTHQVYDLFVCTLDAGHVYYHVYEDHYEDKAEDIFKRAGEV